MPTYVPPKKNTAFIMYAALPSAANAAIFQANPTLAAGDAKVSIDGGALANLTTLPTVTPASGKMVKISLSTSEMNGDNITIVMSDQTSPPEWADVIINIQTSARQIEDLAFPNTSGRGIDVDASGGVEVGTFQAGAITAASIATGAITNAKFAAGAIDAAAIAADAIGASELATDAVTEIATAVWATATRSLTILDEDSTTLDLDATIRAAVGLASANLDTQLTTIDDFLDTEVAAIKAKTDNLPSDPADASDIAAAFGTVNSTLATIAGYIDTEIATLQTSVNDLPTNAELATALGTADDAVLAQIALVKAQTDLIPSDPADASVIAGRFDTLDTSIADLPTNAELATALGTADDAVLTQIALVKAKTDSLTFTVAGQVDANIKSVADTTVTGVGSEADPWGP